MDPAMTTGYKNMQEQTMKMDQSPASSQFQSETLIDRFRVSFFPDRSSQMLTMIFSMLGTFSKAPPDASSLNIDQFKYSLAGFSKKARFTEREYDEVYRTLNRNDNGPLNVHDFVAGIQVRRHALLSKL
jgi:hypothetical protein